MVKFADFVCFEAIVPELQAKGRDEAIDELVSALVKARKIRKSEKGKIAKAITKREKEASTGMGKGVAIPHVKHSGIKKIVAVIGLSSSGIDFSALDKKPVYSVILLLSPEENPDRHLQAMESIFKHLQHDRFRKFLRQCQSADEIVDLLKEADENLYL